MFQWFQQKLGLIGVVITLLGLCFPAVFVKIGEEIKSFTVEYWLQLSIAVIIGLLVAIYLRVVHRE